MRGDSRRGARSLTCGAVRRRSAAPHPRCAAATCCRAAAESPSRSRSRLRSRRTALPPGAGAGPAAPLCPWLPRSASEQTRRSEASGLLPACVRRFQRHNRCGGLWAGGSSSSVQPQISASPSSPRAEGAGGTRARPRPAQAQAAPGGPAAKIQPAKREPWADVGPLPAVIQVLNYNSYCRIMMNIKELINLQWHYSPNGRC